MRTKRFSFGSMICATLFLYSILGGCSSSSDGGDEIPSFTVTYYTERGKTPAAIKVEENTALSSAQLPALYADGYTFNGWRVGSTATSASGYKVISDITLTANWTTTIYTIGFETNGGIWTSGYTPNSTYTIEDEITLPTADKLSKSESAFIGWFENADMVSTSSATTSPQSSPVKKIEKGSSGDKIFYAKWADAVYSIKYQGIDDAAFSEDVILENGFSSENTQITLPAADQISRPGYTFDGWFKEDEASTSSATPITTLTKDSAAKGETLTLYAKWTAIEYEITYKLDGGDWTSGFLEVLTYTIEDEVALPDASNVTKAGYDLEGWYENDAEVSTGSSSASPVTKIKRGTTGNKTFSAKWTLVTYTITYKNVEGAEHPNPGSYTIKTDQFYLRNASKTGYEFDGWYKEDEASSSSASHVYIIEKGSSGNITLYAKWTAIEYKVTFEPNIGEWASGYTPISTYTIEDEVILPTAENITRNGYTFNGWFENPNDRFLPDPPAPATSIPKGSTGNKAFYAKWTETTYTITYENAEGADNPNGSCYAEYTTQKMSIFLNPPSKDGYTFEGWYFVNDGVVSDSPATEIPQGTTGDITLYAKWSIIDYTITFNTNSGKWANDDTPISTYTIEDEVILPTAENITRNGYTFNGWFENPNPPAPATSIPKGSTGNKTFSAKWTAIVYTITYKNAEDADNLPPSTYTVEDKVTLTQASKTGYTFNGWYKTEDFKEIGSIPYGSTGDKTFYAKFIPYKNKISFNSNYDLSENSTKPFYKEIQVIDPAIGNSPYTQTIIFGEETSFIPVNFYSDKWLFTGWNTREDGSGTSYSDKAKVLWNAKNDPSVSDDVVQITESNPSMVSSLKLYAQWKKKTSDSYSITLPQADVGDIQLTNDKTKLTAEFPGFTGTFYWYIDGSDTEIYSSATRISPESTEDLSTCSTIDVAQYLGTEGTDYGVHSVMVKIEYNGNIYTQTAFVSLSQSNH